MPTIGGNITSGEPIMSGGAYDQVSERRPRSRSRSAPRHLVVHACMPPNSQVERLDFFGCRESGRPLCEREDVVSFSSAALEADVEVSNRSGSDGSRSRPGRRVLQLGRVGGGRRGEQQIRIRIYDDWMPPLR